MALSGSLNTSAYDGRYYQLSWTGTQDATTNKTKVSWTLKAVGGNSSWYAERTVKVVIAGTTVYSKTDRVERYAGTVKTGTIDITHNSDGTKSFSTSVQVAVYGSSVNCTGSKTFSLNTIARKSTLSIASGNLGSLHNITVERFSDSFTHTITYTCGTASGTICTKSSDTDILFAPPLSLASQSPNGTSVTVTYKIETFNGSTSLGYNTYTKTHTIPTTTDELAPEVTLSLEDAQGYATTYGAYIQGKSKLKIAVEATGKEGATISSYKVVANGKTYTSANVTTDVISTSGTLAVNVTVTDSRGVTATATADITVFQYSEPKIIAISIQRSDSSGTADTNGAYLCLKFSAEVNSLNLKNTATYKVKYKKKTSSSYTEETISAYANSYSVVNGTYVFSAETGASYDVVLVVEDAFTSVDSTRSGSSISKLFSWLVGGLGWAFGKVAELEGYLEVAFKGIFYDTVDFKEDLYFDNNVAIKGRTTTGYVRDMVWMNSDNETVFGSGSYLVGEYSSKYCGHDIHFLYNNTMYANGKDLFANRVLWSGTFDMRLGQEVALSEPVSEQRNGIILVFSGYDTSAGSPLDNRWTSHFVPKHLVGAKNGAGHSFLMATSTFSYIASKFLYINDSLITGHDNNRASGTTNGITYNNSAYVLRYVIGV